MFKGLKKSIALSKYTTFKIGGKAKYFFIAKNKEDLIAVLKWAKECNEKIFILGGGSNALFSDKGFNGLVIKLEFDEISVKGDMISAGAGAKISKLLDICLRNSLTGLEWASGIPGITVGGAIRGNAGAFGGCMGDMVKSVETLRCNISNHEIKIFDKEACNFGYRTSIFKKEENHIILAADLRMKKGARKAIEAEIKKILLSRNKNQPLGYPNAGSVFKNVNLPQLFDGAQRERVLARRSVMYNGIPCEFKKMGVIPAGWLIEQCGLKGRKRGGAMVSLKHANIIVNYKNAKAKDVLGLMVIIEKEVKKKFGIELEREIEVVA